MKHCKIERYSQKAAIKAKIILKTAYIVITRLTLNQTSLKSVQLPFKINDARSHGCLKKLIISLPPPLFLATDLYKVPGLEHSCLSAPACDPSESLASRVQALRT